MDVPGDFICWDNQVIFVNDYCVVSDVGHDGSDKIEITKLYKYSLLCCGKFSSLGMVFYGDKLIWDVGDLWDLRV